MGGKNQQLEAALNGARTQEPARKRTVYPNYDVSYEDIPEGGKAIIIRLSMPYERHDFPIGDEIAQELGRKLTAAHVVIPDGLPSDLKAV